MDSMADVDVDRVHDGDRTHTLKAIGLQAHQLEGTQLTVRCPCGAWRNVRSMFQCYYCEVWFCSDCADDHFGDNGDGDD